MSVYDLKEIGKPTSETQLSTTSEQLVDKLNQLSLGLRTFVVSAASNGDSFDGTEREVWNLMLRTGFAAMELFVRLQGNGDLGGQVETAQQKTLYRSGTTVSTVVRSVFGEHAFAQHTYSPGSNKKIALRPISARMQLPEHRWSYLLQEFSQMFAVDQAFNQAADNLETVFGEKFSIDTIEQTTLRMGGQADTFLDNLPVPAKQDEAEILIASADCKGVPLIKEITDPVAAFETAKKRPGNRRMATVASAYSVDPYIRTPEQIVAALFRDSKESSKPAPPRPRPKSKHTTAHFPAVYLDDDAELTVSGIHEAMAWISGQIESRRGKRQALIFLMDGQESLWDTVALYFPNDPLLISILDIIHVSSYVWEASSLFHTEKVLRTAFTRERLLKILQGEVGSVIRGLRRMGALQNFKGEKLKDLQRICGYFEKHKERMRYDEYLAAGYPIASGVIEGACGHLVKDRMERSGMRWTLEGARSMLNVRAVFQSDYWNLFNNQRATEQNEIVHPHRHLIENYQPLTLAC